VSNDLDVGLLQIRRAQVASALAALQLDPGALEPMFRVFPEELLDGFGLSCDASLETLELSTVVPADLSALDAWMGAAGAGFEVTWLVEQTWASLQPERCEVGLRANPAGTPPGLRVALRGEWSVMEVYEAFGAAGIAAAAREAWSHLLGRLLVERPVRVEVLHSGEEVGPKIRTAFAWAVSPDHHEPLKAQLDLAADSLGVAAPQRRWFTAMVDAFATRPLDHLEILVECTPHALVPWLAVRYRQVPARRVLKVLVDFGGRSNPGAIFGALMAAVGDEDDEVAWLELSVTPGEKALPRAAFGVEGHGPP